MSSIVSGDVIRIVAKMLYAGGDIQNTYHVRNLGGTVDGDDFMDSMADKLDDAYAEINDDISPLQSYDEIEFFNVTQDEPLGVRDWPVLTVGEGVTETLPLQNAGLVLFGTAVARSQGRKFLGALVEATNTGGGAVSTAFQTAMAAYAAELLDDLVVGVGTFAMGNWNAAKDRFADWISASIRTRLFTQRRRVAGVGS